MLISDLPIAVAAAGTVVLGVSLGFYLWRIALLRSSRSIVAIEIGDDDKLAFRTLDGKWQTAKLQQSSFVSPWLTILNLKPENARWLRNVVILADSMPEEEFRRLRVWLRWKA